MKKIAIMLCFALLTIGLFATLEWTEAVAIRQGVNIEWFRTGIETTDGGAIYVWSDTKLGERDLWAQKVDGAGNMVWGEPVLIDGKPDRQEDPVITRTSDNNYVIAWIDFSADLDGDVYAQKIDGEGNLLWQEGGVPVCTLAGMQIALNMEPDNEGGVYIIWVDSRNPSKDLFGQRLSANGSPLWIVNGIPIATGLGDEMQNTMLPDGEGGMIIAYTHSYAGNDDLYAKRFNANGTMVWQNTLVISEAEGSQSDIRMAALNDGNFVFTWADKRSADTDIYAQKINLTGDLLWGSYLIVYSDQNGLARPQVNPRIVKTSDNGVIIVWEDFRLDTQNPDLFAQKISASGIKQWSEEGIALCTAEFAQLGPRLASDNNGGCFVVWDDLRNGNAPNVDIYAQHLSASGNALWEANGKAICIAPNEQSGSLIKVSNNIVFINWMDIRNGSVGIYYQALTYEGTVLLAVNGAEVFWGLSGDAPLDNYLILKRSSDVVIIWQDTRFANDGYRLFFQFLNPDGSIDLEPNGHPVTVSVGGSQSTPSAVVTPDDQIAIIWEDARGDNPKVYAQLLSANGERLWGEQGMELTVNSPLRQKDPKVSYYNGSLYFGWSGSDQVETSFFYHIYGQRIYNGQKMWGPNGILISTLAQSDLRNECTLYDLIDNYYVWHRINPALATQTIWVKRVAEDGSAMDGWQEEGIQTSNYNDWDAIQLFPKAHKTPEGIFVMWRDLRNDYIQNYWGQHLAENGTYLWNPVGVNLNDNQREQEKASIVVNSSGITFAWCENINGMNDIMAQKYSFPGEPLWTNSGYYVVQRDSAQSDPCLVYFPDGNYLISWADFLNIESDLYYKYITENGEMIGAPQGNVLCNASKSQYQPQTAILNNKAYTVWADGRSSGKTEILGLYAQKLGNGTPVTDVTIPPLQSLILHQNYPNPFNPETTINFTLKDPTLSLKLNIYNIKGQLVKTLYDGALQKGQHSFVWNGTDETNCQVSSGVYFYRLSNGKESRQRKMVLMK
ncbi:MAG TPA: FlgD immunoglobulin-like domain containing protein [Candidatus Cloacimonas acidaminovorans]|nr:FlgD immunoglobulin-like domain containing protein [Candidatus Cloacimonas acidaminovorans]